MDKNIQSSEIKFKTDGNFAIHVTDLEKAENFYGNVLGFKLISKDKLQLVYDTGAITLYINLDNIIIPFIHALEVKNYNDAKNRLAQNGCRIVKEHEGGKALYFKDPFGIIIDIIQK